MKTYLVWIKDYAIEDGIDIVRAETPAQAKYNSVFCGDCDWTELRCKRASALDGKINPTDADYQRAGVWPVCDKCEGFCEYPETTVFNPQTQQAYHVRCVADVCHTAAWGDTVRIEDL